MNYSILTYAIYLPITIALTIWVANALFKNGRVFLLEIFHGSLELAESVNKLLLVGFYLVNIGYAVRTLQIIQQLSNYQQVIEVLSVKIGTIILILGAMHFLNLMIFFNLRKKARISNQPAAVKQRSHEDIAE